MALLTIPSLPTRGTFQNYSLNQADLIALVTQTYFQDKANWKKVILTYVSSVSNQISLVTFSPDEIADVVTAPGFFSSEARSTFQVTNISIYDKQNGRFRLERSQIPNVENYNLVFANASAGTSFFGIGTYGGDKSTHLGFDATDPNKLILGFQGIKDLNANAAYDAVLNLPDGSFNGTLSLKLMDSRIQYMCYNSDLTKAWLMGQFGSQCCGKPIPAPPGGPSYTGLYSSDETMRLVEYDLVADTVTVKVNFQWYESYPSNYLGNQFYTMVIDEVSNTVVVTMSGASSQKVCGYSMTTGSLLWNKNYIPRDSDGYTTPWQIRDFSKDSTSFYMDLNSYNDIAQNGSGIIKASFLTGDIDPSYAMTPSVSPQTRIVKWCYSPDGTKQVIFNSAVSSDISCYIYDNGVISSRITLTGVSSFVYCYATNTNFYLSFYGGEIRKYDFLGNYVATVVQSSAWTGFQAPNYAAIPMAVYEGFIYYSDNNSSAVLKFSESTGARVSNFLGVAANGYWMGAFSFFNSNTMIVNRSFWSAPYYPYYTKTSTSVNTNTGIAIIDYTTKELLDYKGTVNYSTYFDGIFPMTSSLLPGKILTIGSSNPTVYDTTQTNWPTESGWPTNPGQGTGFAGGKIIGNYLYTAAYEATTIMDDTLGRFNGTSLARINLSTKLYDRSFLPTLPGYTATNAMTIVSDTDNYIYVCVAPIFGTTPLLYRIAKSDSTVTQITSSMIGLSGSFGAYKVNVIQIFTDTVLIYPDKSSFNYDPSVNSSTTFNGKPYLILTESTLAPTGTQSSVVTDAPFRLIYNPNSGLLGGVVKDSTDNKFKFVSYVLSTGVRIQGSVALDNYSNVAGGNYYAINGESVFSAEIEGENFLFTVTNGMTYGRKIFNGIIRMNPLGVMSN